MEGVEYIKYSTSPKLWVEEGGKGKAIWWRWVMVVEVVKVKVVGWSNYNYRLDPSILLPFSPVFVVNYKFPN